MRNQVVALCAACALAPAANAALIGLDLQDAPDIASGFINTVYDAGTDVFSATGFALEYDDDGVGPADPITGGSFSITATIDDLGDWSSGSLAIGGSVGGFGPSLLTGDLTDFGFIDGGGMILEFLFEVTGGDLATAYGGLGASFGVILDTRDIGYSGDWTKSFDLIQGVSDTAPVPGPGALALLAIGAVAGRRRRRG